MACNTHTHQYTHTHTTQTHGERNNLFSPVPQSNTHLRIGKKSDCRC